MQTKGTQRRPPYLEPESKLVVFASNFLFLPPSLTHSTTYTLAQVRDLLDLSRTVLKQLIDAGFVSPQLGKGNARRFTLQDLMLLRTACALQAAKVPPKKILGALLRLKSRLPDELPLTGLRITAVGADVVVLDGASSWSADTGQLLIDFEVAVVQGKVAFFPTRPAAVPADNPCELLNRGIGLEATDPAQAEAAYRQALALAPDYVDAYLNLGVLLCELQRVDEAVELYDRAFVNCAESALLHFNCAIALEDLGRLGAAISSYQQCLSIDPKNGDAHFNIGRIHEMQGDMQAALRCFNQYRRLRQP